MDGIPYEIERKFLIAYPDLEWLEKHAERTDIEQTYLNTEVPGETARVRKRDRDGVYQYTHTRKTKLTALRRIEREREISREEYEALLLQADPKRRTIRNSRYCLPYMGQMLEIDVFPFWTDRAYLEIELREEEQRVHIPERFRILREVTADPRYTNAALAAQIPFDDL